MTETSTLTLTVSRILGDLRAGLTRKEIGEKYGFNGVQVKELFKNPKLRGKRTIAEKGAAFVLIDDTEVPVTETVNQTIVDEPVVEETHAGETADEVISVESLGSVAEAPAPTPEPEVVQAPENISGDKSLW